MLVLKRRNSESILIANDILVTVCRIANGSVKIGINAPDTVNIVRLENKNRPRNEDKNDVEELEAYHGLL